MYLYVSIGYIWVDNTYKIWVLSLTVLRDEDKSQSDTERFINESQF